VTRIESRRDLTVRREQHVVEDPELVAREGLFQVLDDQDSEQSALYLLARADVRMEPEGARVLRSELVDEGLARLDGRLGDPGHAVHGVRNADAVPVDGRRLWEMVREPYAKCITEPDAQRRSWNLSVVGPHPHRSTVDQRDRRGCGRHVELAQLASARLAAHREQDEHPDGCGGSRDDASRDDGSHHFSESL